MCGITGFIGRGDRQDLENMTRAIAYRGPDGTGFHIDAEVGLYFGHQRLAIIDIADGAQPLWNERGTICVTFNGEIYNHVELRMVLESKGHKFSTDHSDTEVLVNGWDEWGVDLPAHLNGMFAFAIWDKLTKKVFLARDRFGEKPLFWGIQNGLFLFASELLAFDAHSKFKAKLNRAVLKKFFAYGYIPSPNAIYENTWKLPAGNWLLFDLFTGKTIQNCFWKYRIEINPNAPTLEEAAEEVRYLLLQSIERRLMSDVPIGVFLSGGIDSSATAAGVCKAITPSKVNCFTIGFENASFDETQYAQIMANYLGCNHQIKTLTNSFDGKIVSDILDRMDEPLGDSSLLPTFLLCQLAKKNVTVALSGDGADELFAGYDPFAALAVSNLYTKTIPDFIHSGAKRMADFLPRSTMNMSLGFKVRRALGGLSFKSELWNPTWMAPLLPDEIDDLFQEPTDIEELYSEALRLWRETDTKNEIDKSLEYFGNLYLPDDILCKMDRAAMFNGLEVRSVFLDTDLVEFVKTLPSNYKYGFGNRKRVLKMALDGMLPKSILNRSKKGFGMPIMSMLHKMEVTASGAEGLNLSSDFLEKHIKDHQSGKMDHRLDLWCWVALQNCLKIVR